MIKPPSQRKIPGGKFPASSLIVLGVYFVLIAAACSGGEALVKPQSTPTALPATPVLVQQMKAEMGPSPDDEPSWVFLDDDFADASQAEKGAEAYRLVCAACHGDVGQGLTDEWRATWAPEDQNCWQSKCHGDIHPPDGFALPRFSPPVKGSIIPAMFDNALELYQYNKARMPWHAPGTMRDEEYWQVTAFLVELNGIELGDTILDETSAAQVSLKP